MMDGVAIGLSLLVTLALIVYIAWPWWVRRGDSPPESGSMARSAQETQDKMLIKRYEAVLTTLRDLDFDHAVGKVAAEDYGPLRQALLAEAAGIMAQLDEKQAAAEAGLDARIEAEILAVRQMLRTEQDHGVSTCSPVRPAACSVCGRAARPGDLYCTGCGAQLNPQCPACGQAVHPTAANL